MRNIYYAVSLLFLISGTVTLQQVSAQNYPANFSQVRVITGVNRPTAMAFAPDGRVFICEQGGNLRVVKNNALLATPFVQLTVSSVGERGLVGVAVDPDFATNRFVYLYYTVAGSPARNRVSRFTANGDVAQAGSETLILNLDPLSTATIHNGGAMHFGIDGKLYIAVGENSNASNAQNLDTYHGKLLRINKDGSVPSGNPYTTGSEQRRRVWASGLRNPFTFAIHPQSGRILINDVGGNSWEEINDATVGGRNFGWPTTEGTFNQSNFPNLTNPVYAYAHGTGDGVGCAITGGTFFSPSATNYPATYRGRYFFEDSCNDWFNTLTFSGSSATRSPFATSVADNSLGMTTGPDGNLYFLSRAGQALYKVVYNGAATLTITNQPVNASVAVGQPVTFSVSASGAAPITYQWQKNSTNIPNATGAAYTIQQTKLTDAGQYRVIVSNASGSVTSSAATLTVISNALPVAEIMTPAAGTTYVAGTNIGFSGKGTDPEDGTLPAQSFSWEINFHHNDHKHDQPAINGITSGTFNIPNEGETSDNVWYRLILTVTDGNGLKGKDSVDIFPLKSTITFATVPAGLQIMLDGQPFSTPGSVVSVEGIRRTIDAPAFQTVNNITYQFNSWSHGGAKNQTIATPTNNITYTANFVEVENNKSFFRAINFNGSSLSIDGNAWEAGSSAPNFSYTNGRTFANQNIALSPSTDANRATMIRSSIWGRVNAAVSAVPAGDYEVWVYTWEDNYPTTFSIFLEETVVQTNFTSGSAGSWKKLGPYNVTINDGTINLYVNGYESNLSGIEIWRIVQPPANNPPVVLNPLVDQTATVAAPFSFTFPANSFADPDPADVLIYSAALSNGTALPSWLTFNGNQRTFSGTSTISNVGELEVRVTATDKSNAQATDVFTITVDAPEEAQFYRAINLNGPAITVDGNNWEASQSAPNFSYSNGKTFANQNIALIPATDANRSTMIRSSIWGKVNIAVTAVPPGDYEVWLYTWEDNYPATFSILLEGTVVQANYTSGSAGTWSKLGPFVAMINDGSINLSATGYESNLSGIEIWNAASAGARNATTARLAVEEGKELKQEPMLVAYPNPFSNAVKITASATQSAPSNLVMFDMRGIKVNSLFEGPLESGTTMEMDIEPTDLANGIYILQWINGQNTKRLKLVVNK